MTPATTVIKEMAYKGRLMNADEYANYFKDICLKKRSLLQLDPGFFSFKDKETIYMHDYFCFGKFSKVMNFFTLGHFLTGEAILLPRHKWEEIIENIYYCQIEAFHIFIYRHQWHNNIDFFIFMDDQLSALMKHTFWSRKAYTLVDDINNLMPFFKYNFCEKMIGTHFSKRYPLRVKSLKQLAEFQMTMNMFFKRMELIGQEFLRGGIMTASMESSKQYINSLRNLLIGMSTLGERSKMKYISCSMRGEQYTIIDPCRIESSFERIKTKATMAPFQAHHTVAKLSDSLRQFGPQVLTQFYCSLSPDV